MFKKLFFFKVLTMPSLKILLNTKCAVKIQKVNTGCPSHIGHKDLHKSVLKAFFQMIPLLITLYTLGVRQNFALHTVCANLSVKWIREKLSIVLTSAFGTQVISGNTEIAWPACSPYEAPCDNFLWGICDQEIRKVKPRDLGELQEVVSDFVQSLDEDVARRAIRDIRPRAEMCIKLATVTVEEILKWNN